MKWSSVFVWCVMKQCQAVMFLCLSLSQKSVHCNWLLMATIWIWIHHLLNREMIWSSSMKMWSKNDFTFCHPVFSLFLSYFFTFPKDGNFHLRQKIKSLSCTLGHENKNHFSIVAFTERNKIDNEVPPLLIYECSLKKKKKKHEKPHILCFREELILQNNKKKYKKKLSAEFIKLTSSHL